MSVGTHSPTTAQIDPRTTLGTVRLTVSDLSRSRAFYERTIGLLPRELDDGGLAFGVAEGGPALVELRGDPAAPPLRRRATGLFHLAVLVPSRRDLAFALARLADTRWQLDGASDHLVSEALYLSDPDGNGIEIYRDRPRAEWRMQDGRLQMATLPLDLRSVLGELPEDAARQPIAPAGTVIGHVHLQVSELERTEAFYAGMLGFDVIVRGYSGALFVSAGGYHHHIGLNTWNSAGAATPPAGSVGLRSFEIELPDRVELEVALARIAAAGLGTSLDPGTGGHLVHDPSGNGVLLRARIASDAPPLRY
jgi:catechol 2,3-dioxygenase